MVYMNSAEGVWHFSAFINPRRACAARVTVLALCASWGAFFSMKGGKGGERGGKGKRVKVQIKEGNSNFIFIQK